MMPSAPPSSTRPINEASRAGTRTSGVTPASRVALQMRLADCSDRGMLQVDVQRVQAGGRGDAADLGAVEQAHDQRGGQAAFRSVRSNGLVSVESDMTVPG